MYKKHALIGSLKGMQLVVSEIVQFLFFSLETKLVSFPVNFF